MHQAGSQQPCQPRGLSLPWTRKWFSPRVESQGAGEWGGSQGAGKAGVGEGGTNQANLGEPGGRDMPGAQGSGCQHSVHTEEVSTSNSSPSKKWADTATMPPAILSMVNLGSKDLLSWDSLFDKNTNSALEWLAADKIWGLFWYTINKEQVDSARAYINILFFPPIWEDVKILVQEPVCGELEVCQSNNTDSHVLAMLALYSSTNQNVHTLWEEPRSLA